MCISYNIVCKAEIIHSVDIYKLHQRGLIQSIVKHRRIFLVFQYINISCAKSQIYDYEYKSIIKSFTK